MNVFLHSHGYKNIDNEEEEFNQQIEEQINYLRQGCGTDQLNFDHFDQFHTLDLGFYIISLMKLGN